VKSFASVVFQLSNTLYWTGCGEWSDIAGGFGDWWPDKGIGLETVVGVILSEGDGIIKWGTFQRSAMA
jgi:hypothetical protein